MAPFLHLGSGVVPLGYMSKFLDEEMRSLNEKFKEIDKVYPTNSKLITAPDARICFSLNYIRQLAAAHSEVFPHIADFH